MNILVSTQYVDLSEQKDSWIQLDVISQWDFKTKAICFENLSGTRISYCLKLNTPISKVSYNSDIITDITDEIKSELISMGYNNLDPL